MYYSVLARLLGIPAPPTYVIVPGASSVDEGASITYTVNTKGVSGTLYWTINFNGSSASADFSAVSGSFTITNDTGSFTITTLADQLTEGSQTFYVEVRVTSISGRIVATTLDNITTINDTSMTPAAAFSIAPTSIDEGTTNTYTVTTTNFPSGTLYWTITHGTTALADFSADSGSFTVSSSSGSFNIITTADNTTEGAQTFTVSVRLTSISGTVLTTSNTITVNDTSLSPTAAFTSVPANVAETPGTVTFSVSTTNFSSGTLYWTINHVTTSAADFSAVSGSFTITAGAGSFNITAVADVTTEGNETFTVSVRLTSISGTILATSSPATTITDTSLTVPGQLVHNTTLNVAWVCPATVTRVSIVCRGGGGGGVGFTSTTINQGGGGGGGACSYINNVAVTPGVTYNLYIPATATGFSGGNGYSGAIGTHAGNGSYAMFGTTNVPSTSLCAAAGGHGGRGTSTEATPPYTVPLSGGAGGGNATLDNNVGTLGMGGNGGAGGGLVAAGGGGAGGYGTIGGVGAGNGVTTPGAGGGSGAGAGGNRSTTASTNGTNGAGGSILGTSPGGGTLYGGGGAAGFGVAGLRGMNGAVRIMWPGQTRSYPATNAGDL